MGFVKERQLFLASIWLGLCSACVGSRFIQLAAADGTTIFTLCYGSLSFGFLILSLCSWDISRLQPADSHSFFSLITQYVIWRVAIFYGRFVYDSFLAKTDDVDLSQEEILIQEFILPNVDTEFGRKYNFKNIRSRDDFRRRVPVMTYDDYAPYISRIESNPEDLEGVLTSSPVEFLAVTSGTTGKNKVIPVTSFVKRKAALHMLTLTMYILSLKSKFTLQRRLRLGYRPRVETSMSGLKKAPISYFMRRTLPFSPVPAEVYDIKDEQKALYIQALIALSERELGHLDGFMSTLVWTFWQIVEKNWEQMCDDLETGKISERVKVEQYIRDAVEKILTPNPSRAAELRKEFAKGTSALAHRIWPSLDSVRMITSGAFAHYTCLLRAQEMKGIKVLNPFHHGSEGIYGVDIWPSADPEKTRFCSFTMGYNEFLPVQSQGEDQTGAASRNTQTLYPEQLEVGKLYEMVVTSPMGLYRYRMGDVVKVVDFFNQCPIYEFQYRTGHILNCFWEKTTENVFYEALSQSMSKLELNLEDYTTTEDVTLQGLPGYTANSDCKHYTLFLEVSRLDGSRSPLTEEEKLTMDECLCQKMELYKTLREKNSIGPLHVMQVRPGTFNRLRSFLLSSLSNQQTKMPRVIRAPEPLKQLIRESLEVS